MNILEAMTMTDEQSRAVQAQVRAQFDRQVTHYTQGSAMADQGLLELIVRMAGPTSGPRSAFPRRPTDAPHRTSEAIDGSLQRLDGRTSLRGG